MGRLRNIQKFYDFGQKFCTVHQLFFIPPSLVQLSPTYFRKSTSPLVQHFLKDWMLCDIRVTICCKAFFCRPKTFPRLEIRQNSLNYFSLQIWGFLKGGNLSQMISCCLLVETICAYEYLPVHMYIFVLYSYYNDTCRRRLFEFILRRTTNF